MEDGLQERNARLKERGGIMGDKCVNEKERIELKLRKKKLLKKKNA